MRARALEESSGKDVLFDAVHLRRGNFVQTYGDAVPSVDDITTVVEERIERGSTLYMSTDESQVGFQDLVSSLGSDYTTVTLHDYLGVLSGVNVNFFGPIDQIVASKSRTFVGTYYSAFTGYINRLRGYHSTVPEEDKRADGIVASYYFAPNAVRADMRVYKAIRRPFFAREWPVSWRQIDADISDEFTHTSTYMSSAILRSSFAASVRTTFSKSQRTTINTKRSVMTKAVTITEGVEFDTVAREWRMKWSPDDDKASLAAAQKVLEKQLATVKAVKGVKSVQRVVCGGCMDFKVIVALDGDSFGEWEAAGFAPEADFLKEVESIKGIQQVETQTFTLMPM